MSKDKIVLLRQHLQKYKRLGKRFLPMWMGRQFNLSVYQKRVLTEIEKEKP